RRPPRRLLMVPPVATSRTRGRAAWSAVARVAPVAGVAGWACVVPAPQAAASTRARTDLRMRGIRPVQALEPVREAPGGRISRVVVERHQRGRHALRGHHVRTPALPLHL